MRGVGELVWLNVLNFRRGLDAPSVAFDWCPSSERVGVFPLWVPPSGQGKLPPLRFLRAQAQAPGL